MAMVLRVDGEWKNPLVPAGQQMACHGEPSPCGNRLVFRRSNSNGQSAIGFYAHVTQHVARLTATLLIVAYHRGS